MVQVLQSNYLCITYLLSTYYVYSLVLNVWGHSLINRQKNNTAALLLLCLHFVAFIKGRLFFFFFLILFIYLFIYFCLFFRLHNFYQTIFKFTDYFFCQFKSIVEPLQWIFSFQWHCTFQLCIWFFYNFYLIIDILCLMRCCHCVSFTSSSVVSFSSLYIFVVATVKSVC